MTSKSGTALEAAYNAYAKLAGVSPAAPIREAIKAFLEEQNVESLAEIAHNNYWADGYENASAVEKAAALQIATAIIEKILGEVR